MRWRKGRCAGLARWLGLLALALNALVSIHLAFDISEALAATRATEVHAGGVTAEWSVLAVLTGHSHPGNKPGAPGKHHGTACPVCAAAGTFAGFVPASPVALPIPASAAAPSILPKPVGKPTGALTAYRSRAPPVS